MAERAIWAKTTPMIINRTPPISENATAVCTAQCTLSGFLAPLERPTKKPTRRLIRVLVVPPTAASACLPTKRPTTTASAVL